MTVESEKFELEAADVTVEKFHADDQRANENPRAVRITHNPTGLSVTRKVGSSSIENTRMAYATLRAIVEDQLRIDHLSTSTIPTLSQEEVQAVQDRLRRSADLREERSDSPVKARIVDELLEREQPQEQRRFFVPDIQHAQHTIDEAWQVIVTNILTIARLERERDDAGATPTQ